ncbi:MAG: hypothetical protein V7754_23160, partial [Halioglobus sp.]
MAIALSDNRRRRLWRRLEGSPTGDPAQTLEAIEQLLADGADRQTLLLLKARALSRSTQFGEASQCWGELLQDGDNNLALEAL